MKRRLNRHQVTLGLMVLEAKIASGNHQAIDIALDMVNDLLTDPKICDKVKATFPNESTVMEIQRDGRQYLMMWRTYMKLVFDLEKRVEAMEDDE